MDGISIGAIIFALIGVLLAHFALSTHNVRPQGM